ncbi:MAG: nucleoside recognition domain-containing protein [Pseudomonadota bacterium]
MQLTKETDHDGPIEHSLEIALEKIEKLLNGNYTLSKRAIGLLLLQEDQEIKELVKETQPDIISRIEKITESVKSCYTHPLEYEVALLRKEEVDRIINKVVKVKEERISFVEKLSRLMMNPIAGLPILFFILYFGLYKFVGNFGAGTVVNFIEGTIFDKHLNPFLVKVFSSLVPWRVLQDLLIGEYGVLTLGIRYTVALILPIVSFFLIFFSIIEDTGYLPRLAMLIDRTFKKIGLSGRAVIPMVLGFGCATMATLVTRTLPTKRERIIATMLLALAVPCSAQLGVILALLEGHPKAMVIWVGIISLVFLFIGFLTSKLLPGEKPSFYIEIPPLRLPNLSNILTKTYARVKWYFMEILPLFLLASVFIWFGKLTHLFDFIISVLRKPVTMVGLPPEAAKIFLFGFFRRDYGAAGLYDLHKGEVLTGDQLVVACVALTLFLPCIAQFLMNLKERGWKTGVGISLFTLCVSFGVAFTVNLVLNKLGVRL